MPRIGVVIQRGGQVVIAMLKNCQITGVSAPPDNSKDAPLVYGKSAPLIYGHIHPGQR